ncbi:hypothetical protein B0H13DRAFT_856725 [Mycena leptocephala]|nr:hypothetical protein B0H13DRAFT_856725 [Mycena leptocephala]
MPFADYADVPRLTRARPLAVPSLTTRCPASPTKLMPPRCATSAPSLPLADHAKARSARPSPTPPRAPPRPTSKSLCPPANPRLAHNPDARIARPFTIPPTSSLSRLRRMQQLAPPAVPPAPRPLFTRNSAPTAFLHPSHCLYSPFHPAPSPPRPSPFKTHSLSLICIAFTYLYPFKSSRESQIFYPYVPS